jgi:hypothetical protein
MVINVDKLQHKYISRGKVYQIPLDICFSQALKRRPRCVGGDVFLGGLHVRQNISGEN